MKVYMIGSANPSLNCGGAEVTIRDLSSFLVRKKHEVVNFCYDNRPHEEGGELGNIIALKKYRNFSVNKFLYTFRVARKLKKMLPNDSEGCLVHGHVDNPFVYALFRKHNMPFMFTSQGNAYVTYKLDFREIDVKYKHKGFIKKNLAYLSEKYFKKHVFSLMRYVPDWISTKRSDLIVACSNKVKKEIVELYGINSDKIKVIYNGVNRDLFKPMKREMVRKKLGLDLNKRYGLWVGVMPTIKGLDIAVEAVKGIKNLELLVVGGTGKYGSLKTDNVKFLGGADQKKLNLFYNATDFLISPSRYDAFGIVNLEAMATGTPVIISKNCGASEIIKNGENGFALDTLNPDDYREKIEYILSNKNVQEKMSKKCLETAEKYGWDKQGEKYLRAYERVLKNR